MRAIANWVVLASWVGFFAAFLWRERTVRKQPHVIKASRANWGLALQGIALAVLWSQRSSETPRAGAVAAAAVLGAVAIWGAWTAVIHLGKQWRVQAALSADHELVMTGPYAVVRHPIYAALLALLAATGLLVAERTVFAAALIVYLCGTEIRVRAEDKLLGGRFGEAFQRYRDRVPAYLPFVR